MGWPFFIYDPGADLVTQSVYGQSDRLHLTGRE
jgi:hypothetical protein